MIDELNNEQEIKDVYGFDELNEIKQEVTEIKAHSETWNLLKYQSEQAGKERFRQWVLILVLIILLVVSNLAWLMVWSQYEYVDVEATQDGTGVNIVGAGDVDYGTNSTDSD